MATITDAPPDIYYTHDVVPVGVEQEETKQGGTQRQRTSPRLHAAPSVRVAPIEYLIGGRWGGAGL